MDSLGRATRNLQKVDGAIRPVRLDASHEQTDLAVYPSDLASGFRSAIEKAGLFFLRRSIRMGSVRRIVMAVSETRSRLPEKKNVAAWQHRRSGRKQASSTTLSKHTPVSSTRTVEP